MKHPFWIANSTLLILALIIITGIFIFRTPALEFSSLEPFASGAIRREKSVMLDINKIFREDLFDTYRPEKPEITQEELPQLPLPPKTNPIEVPPLPKPTFLDPLPIKLKGIIAVSGDIGRNRAILEEQEGKEKIYQVGDTKLDAQLIRIFNNKIIFLRANGQQEVLYLREEDAKKDSTYLALESWDQIVQKTDENIYLVDPQRFIERVGNLAQVIDLLALSTVYRKGEPIGIRIGHLPENSLGGRLGFQTGDMVTMINSIEPTTNQNRMKIYQEITNMQVNDILKCTVKRSTKTIIITIMLQEFTPRERIPEPVFLRMQEEQKKKALEEKYKFAPTLNQLQKQERQQMFTRGSAPVAK